MMVKSKATPLSHIQYEFPAFGQQKAIPVAQFRTPLYSYDQVVLVQKKAMGLQVHVF